MKVISKTGDPRFAEVYVARVRNNPEALIEFVDAADPRYLKSEKWVIIVSTQIGCPIGCLMCDSGTYFLDNLTKDEIFAQIEHVFASCDIHNHPKLKIQFARMGEPSLNPAVLDVLEELPTRYPIKGLMPCVATTAPVVANGWFERLSEIKTKYYSGGRFQLQFSINSTDEAERDRIMPTKKWKLEDIARYGDKFYKNGDRKITLNFALATKADINVDIIKRHFNPKTFLIKITPVNPTDMAGENRLDSVISVEKPYNADNISKELKTAGYDTIISIGAVEEIAIGSNCGQSTRRLIKKDQEYHKISI